MLFVGPTFQWGYVVTCQASIAGDDEHDDVNLVTFQPIDLWQLGHGWYLRSTGPWTFGFDTHAMPVGLGLRRMTPAPA